MRKLIPPRLQNVWCSLKFRIALLVLTSFAFMTSTARSAPATPDTPAGNVFSAWLAVINSGDIDQIRSFTSHHENDEEFVQIRLRTHHVLGGLKLLGVKKSEPATIVAYVEDRRVENAHEVELVLQSSEPPKLGKIILRPAVLPPELQVSRLTEAEAVAKLSEKAETLAKEDYFSGAVLVARQGKILFQGAYGFSDRAAKLPVSLDTQFRIGSINKSFTAVAMLQLIESGKASLVDTVGKFLPDYPDDDTKKKVTIRQLLTHTGGTGNIFGEEYAQRRLELKQHDDYVKIFGARVPAFEPGSQFDYSNYGYILLGRLIEVISGLSYYDYVERMIFTPAGMGATGSLPESQHVPQRSVGYTWEGGKLVSNENVLPFRGTSAGGGYSTVGDFLKLAEALKAGKLISKTMLAEATLPHYESYGYGFGIAGQGKLLNYGHGGGFPGMNAGVRIFPNSGYVLVSLSNFDTPIAEQLLNYFEARMPLD